MSFLLVCVVVIVLGSYFYLFFPGYNEMKTHLSEYLAKFVENKKVVREEDIREFFTGMQARKRQKTDVPYNCR